MGLSLEWVYECCVCKVEVRQPGRVPIDDLTVPVPSAIPEGWECDGLGGYLCGACYATWSKEQGKHR